MSIGFTSRPYLRHALLALLVLGLMFLNFGSNAAARAETGYGVSAGVWCGDPVSPAAPDHKPCHACRNDGMAALPPAPAAATAVVFAVTPVAYVSVIATPGVAGTFRPAQPRGPPLPV